MWPAITLRNVRDNKFADQFPTNHTVLETFITRAMLTVIYEKKKCKQQQQERHNTLVVNDLVFGKREKQAGKSGYYIRF